MYLEADAPGVSPGASLLQVWAGMQFPRNEAPENAVLWQTAFASKSLTNAETHYSNIEREAVGIPCGLENCCHYCFTPEVSMIIV